MTRIKNVAVRDIEEQAMARIRGIESDKTSFLMRQVFRQVRKIFGKDLTPQKIQARRSPTPRRMSARICTPSCAGTLKRSN
jgi:hypothetical protein